MAPFNGLGSTGKPPKVPGTHLINIRMMKSRFDLEQSNGFEPGT